MQNIHATGKSTPAQRSGASDPPTSDRTEERLAAEFQHSPVDWRVHAPPDANSSANSSANPSTTTTSTATSAGAATTSTTTSTTTATTTTTSTTTSTPPWHESLVDSGLTVRGDEGLIQAGREPLLTDDGEIRLKTTRGPTDTRSQMLLPWAERQAHLMKERNQAVQDLRDAQASLQSAEAVLQRARDTKTTREEASQRLGFEPSLADMEASTAAIARAEEACHALRGWCLQLRQRRDDLQQQVESEGQALTGFLRLPEKDLKKILRLMVPEAPRAEIMDAPEYASFRPDYMLAALWVALGARAGIVERPVHQILNALSAPAALPAAVSQLLDLLQGSGFSSQRASELVTGPTGAVPDETVSRLDMPIGVIFILFIAYCMHRAVQRQGD